jgi:hypothetical protein
MHEATEVSDMIINSAAWLLSDLIYSGLPTWLRTLAADVLGNEVRNQTISYHLELQENTGQYRNAPT